MSAAPSTHATEVATSAPSLEAAMQRPASSLPQKQTPSSDARDTMEGSAEIDLEEEDDADLELSVLAQVSLPVTVCRTRTLRTQTHSAGRSNSISSAACKRTSTNDARRMPKSFEYWILAFNFAFMSNYTVILPTAHDYAHSLGGGGWFAGLTIAASVLPCLVTSIAAFKLIKHSYKPVLFAQCITCILGNVQYSLALPLDCKWLLLTGAATRVFMYGAAGTSLALHSINTCSAKQFRSDTTSMLGNMRFLGMGLGPVFAAMLSPLNFSFGYFAVVDNTVSGWFYAIVFFLMMLWLIVVPEPERHFAQAPAAVKRAKSARKVVSEGAADLEMGAAGKTANKEASPLSGVRAEVAWCVLVIFTAMHSMALWEASAAVLTQAKFGWTLQVSSIFMGLIFCFAMVSGEAMRRLVRGPLAHVSEANLALHVLLAMAGSSALLYWYLPDGAAQSLSLANQMVYIVGSAVYMFTANAATTYATTIVMRTALAAGGRAKDMVSSHASVIMIVGRGVGAFLGMGVGGMAEGVNISAGLISFWPALCLALLAAPGLLQKLRSH